MKKLFLLFISLFFGGIIFSQNTPSAGEIHGNFQANGQYYNPDASIGAPPVPEKTLIQGFSNLMYSTGNFTAGIRYETYQNPMQGYDPRYKGSGIPYRFATYKLNELEVTIGNYYEQFGSGIVLRAYEEKGLGIDNVLDGMRVKFSSHGFYLKGLVGKQRSYWGQGAGLVRGFDGEVNLNELFARPNDSTYQAPKTKITLGGSFVSKYQDGDQVTYQSSTLKVPQNVGASAGRIGISRGKVNITGEYVYKINDPTAFNSYIYKPGDAMLINANYSQKGFGVYLGMKRIDNMSYKSDRNATANDLNMNFIPSFTKQHTYSLLAFYPYATQPNGEINYQTEILKKFKKGSALGGKYGTDITLNFSQVYALDTTRYSSLDSTRQGYKSNYFGMGKRKYYSDFNVEISKKLSPKMKMLVIYANQDYNKDVIQGESGFGAFIANTGLVELTYHMNGAKSLRMELQHLYTKEDFKNWAMVLLEYGAGEHFLISAFDQYNYGNDIEADRIHYYTAAVTYLKDATRISIGYGKQRAGIFCVGGVCRYVPASNGLSIAITTTF